MRRPDQLKDVATGMIAYWAKAHTYEDVREYAEFHDLELNRDDCKAVIALIEEARIIVKWGR